MRCLRIGAAFAAVAGLALSSCGGSDSGGADGTAQAPPGESSFAAYDWEPNLVAPKGAQDPSVGESREVAEQLAASNQGTIVLLGPAPVDLPDTKIDESKGQTRKYFVLRDRPALEESDVQSATVQTDPTGQRSIIIELTPGGAQKYGKLTYKQARRGSTPPPGPLGGPYIGPRTAIVTGDEIIAIHQLGPGSYTRQPVAAITLVGNFDFDEERAQELADSIDPG